MRLIPAIDIIEGKCVRLTRGDYNQKTVYNEDPLEVAKMFEDHGIHYLHLVDLDGAKSKGIVNYRVLEKIASNTGLKIDFGGGIKTAKDIEIAFNSGAAQVTGGSIAVKDRDLFLSWLKLYGSDKLILGADARDQKIATGGWKENSEIELLPFISGYVAEGISYVICTDISKDGMLEGPATELYRSIVANEGRVRLIASGGISSMDDLQSVAQAGCEGAIIGKAIYENRITLKELEQYQLDAD